MWQKELSVAGQAAREAGGILNRLFGQVNHIQKKGTIDLVSEADLMAEKSILEAIGRNFPYDNILCEESGRHGKDSDRTWIIDPLDGTTNFIHGFPFFAVSIALEVKGQIVLGIVWNPFMDEYFSNLPGKAGSHGGNGGAAVDLKGQVRRTREIAVCRRVFIGPGPDLPVFESMDGMHL